MPLPRSRARAPRRAARPAAPEAASPPRGRAASRVAVGLGRLSGFGVRWLGGPIGGHLRAASRLAEPAHGREPGAADPGSCPSRSLLKVAEWVNPPVVKRTAQGGKVLERLSLVEVLAT